MLIHKGSVERFGLFVIVFYGQVEHTHIFQAAPAFQFFLQYSAKAHPLIGLVHAQDVYPAYFEGGDPSSVLTRSDSFFQ